MKTLSKDQIIKVIHLCDELINSPSVDISKIDKPTEDTLKMYEKTAELIQRHWNDYSLIRKNKTAKELSQMILESTPAKDWMITINCKSTDSVGYGIRRIKFSRDKIITYTSDEVGKDYSYLTEQARESVLKTIEQLIPTIIGEMNRNTTFYFKDFDF